MLARVLITSWSLATGRTLRSVAPQALTEDELISFWADDKIDERRMPAARVLTEDDWRRERAYLQEHRYDLAVEAAAEYPADRRMAGTPLLAAPGWQPAEPVPLRDIALELTPAAAAGPAWALAGRRWRTWPRCPAARTGLVTRAIPTRCARWPPRRCSRTVPPTG